jgi:hypothetical protein
MSTENEDTSTGNKPELWTLLLRELDDKLQLALLARLKRVSSYHMESTTLFITPGSEEDQEYLTRNDTLQQLNLIAEATMGATSVTIHPVD